jgi:hypothetical protein
LFKSAECVTRGSIAINVQNWPKTAEIDGLSVVFKLDSLAIPAILAISFVISAPSEDK